MTAWKNETARRLAGAVACMPIEGDWPEVGDPTDKRWHEALSPARIRPRQLDCRRQSAPQKRSFTNQPTTHAAGPLGTGVSHYVLLHGIVQHDVYHAGQIAILKKGL